jgi:hypothetical protein
MGYVYNAIPAATKDATQNNQNGAHHHGFEDAFIFLPLDLGVMVSAPEFEPSFSVCASSGAHTHLTTNGHKAFSAHCVTDKSGKHYTSCFDLKMGLRR